MNLINYNFELQGKEKHSKMNFSDFFPLVTKTEMSDNVGEMHQWKYNFGITIEFDCKYVFL